MEAGCLAVAIVACHLDGTTWAGADSRGRRNGAGGWRSVGALEELTHEVRWSLPAKCFSRPVIDFCGDLGEPFGAVNGKVGAFREVLSEESVHILIGAAFPWRVGVTEEDRRSGSIRDEAVRGQFLTLVPSQRTAQGKGKGFKGWNQRLRHFRSGSSPG